MFRSALVVFLLFCMWQHITFAQPTMTQHPDILHLPAENHKIIIYQLLVRLFGNKNTTNKFYGSKEENGVGKFDDITPEALRGIKQLGTTHVWYTGVIEHATMSDHTAWGIPLDDPDVVKGRAGSPYAIKDYYDVCPDLANNPRQRMAEFEALIKRTHAEGLKVLIDFVPNHVARRYRSDAKPPGVADLGEHDDTSKAFSPQNNFYYLPGQAFQVPAAYQLPAHVQVPGKDGFFDENPAKATGNDVFSATPSVHDWFETVKLNYGVDYLNNRTKHFDPLPNTWLKMRDILLFWAAKGVDGFRCDMAEMVPVEFWQWCIPQIKQQYPHLLFIAEIYNPAEYENYVQKGKFDYLYDKVGLYDTLKAVIQGRASANSITANWQQLGTLHSHMLRFLENHDEQRLPSPFFAIDSYKGIPLMAVSAMLGTGPVMMYFGQEVGEPGAGAAGFSGDDGRTTIFDFWGVPMHQRWMNGGKFDGGQLEDWQKNLRERYAALLNFAKHNAAINSGKLYDLQPANNSGKSAGYDDAQQYAFLRFTNQQRLLILVNFDAFAAKHFHLRIPEAAWLTMGLNPQGKYSLRGVLFNHDTHSFSAQQAQSEGIALYLPQLGTAVFELVEK
ncbi:MAG: alpha-amylase family protein [Cytophagales bacterium]|nr:alpha-amylase family protein [Bernardetiaceae bacterium]MDW8203421.1 alpha-amylase family protein [Cytophagales bacterium]